MQLPIYLYLANKHPKFNNIDIAGFYLQKILNNEIVAEKKYTYEELKKKNLLLQGYSNDNLNILNYFDNTYEDSKVIKSLKMTSKGFYSYSKVFNNETINKLVKISEDKIKEASNDILSAKFDINPKRVGINNLGCEFCSFKDVCFMKEKDIINLKEYKNMEFLGGEDNA
jgi:ATP-dependent helicase/DNAse subunit B